MKIPFRDWYCEEKEQPSSVEIFLFYINIPFLVCFMFFVLTNTSYAKYLILLLPLLIWIFMRSSRKDMKATAHWVAGFIGAIGGAASILLLKIFLK
jgi:hypothetical protein